MAITLNGTTGITNDGAYTGDGVVFADGTPSNTLVTNTSGNVGIGTSSPNSAAVGRAITINSAATSSGTICELNGGGVRQAYLFSNDANVVLSSVQSLPLRFNTADTERMRITSSGNLLIGTTTDGGNESKVYVTQGGGNWTFTSNQTFSTQYHMTFRYNGTQLGYISSNGSTTSYVTSSDYRLKENIAPMTGALAKVSALKPVTYNWKVDGSAGQGFIAHELAEVVPDAVTGEKDAVDAEGNPVYQGIDTSFLVATLTAALQELNAKVDALQTELATLKGAS